MELRRLSFNFCLNCSIGLFIRDLKVSDGLSDVVGIEGGRDNLEAGEVGLSDGTYLFLGSKLILEEGISCNCWNVTEDGPLSIDPVGLLTEGFLSIPG